MAGIGVSWLLRLFSKTIRNWAIPVKEVAVGKKKKEKGKLPILVAIIGMLYLSYLTTNYVFHATAAGKNNNNFLNILGGEAYSSPSVILSNRDR